MIFLEIDPNIVKPGWTPLLITVAIAAVMVFGFFSMRNQFRRINVPGGPTESVEGDDVAGSDPQTPDVGTTGPRPTDAGEPSSASRTRTSSTSPPG